MIFRVVSRMLIGNAGYFEILYGEYVYEKAA